MVTCPIRYSKQKSVDGNILGRWISAETVFHTFVISYKVNIANIGNDDAASEWKGQAITGHHLPHQLDI